MIFAIIVAGGIGSRMKLSEMPKQFLELAGKPIIIHTLEKFLLCSRLDYIYLGIHKNYMSYTKELIDKYNIKSNKFVITQGADNRNGTILNAIVDIEKKYGNEGHIVVTHDAVRPFVKLSAIEENINSAKKYGCCDTVTESADTIVSSKDGKVIDFIPPRVQMFLGQTPQSFKMDLFLKFYSQLSDEEKLSLTDACSVFVKRNHPVHLVKSDTTNMKITTVSDFKIANAMLGCNNEVGGTVID